MLLIPVILLILLLSFLLIRGWTPAIRGRFGKRIPGSIASLEKIHLGGLDQSILIRGWDQANPILLFLHGGPGMPAMFLAHHFQRELEKHFTIVHWDRRGAGKSYYPDIPFETMTVKTIVGDACQLIRYLCERFHQDRMYLVGHSWGTYLGMLLVDQYPELFRAYIAIGQLTGKGHDSEDIAEIQLDFIRRRAAETNQQQALKELETPENLNREKWLFYFGGELHRSKNLLPILMAGFFSPEYTLRDIQNIAPGSSFTAKYMKYDLMDEPLISRVTTVKVPVYFFTGRHDYTDPFQLTEEYFEKIKAPVKKMVWFEESAHFPFFEEPQRFTEEMVRVLEEGK